VREWFREMVHTSGVLKGMEDTLALREVEEDGSIQTTLNVDDEE